MRSGREHETALELALECLAMSGFLRLKVTGASMLPGIRPGSYAMICRLPADEINPGDIVLARSSAGVRLHRLIEIQGEGADSIWITRGDHNGHCDPPMRTDEYLGVLTSVEQPGRVNWFSRLMRLARTV